VFSARDILRELRCGRNTQFSNLQEIVKMQMRDADGALIAGPEKRLAKHAIGALGAVLPIGLVG
jgi:hypothetical protein